MSAADDERFMGRAVELALRAWGNTHPNPMVGSVLAEEGVVTSEAFHERDGGPHAERTVLASLMRNPHPGATLYVTLEPCSTQGRTGACTDAIISAGIKRVVVGATDPNPAHAGRGYEVLRKAGVEVITGVLGAECADMNLIFNHWIVRREPLLAGKVAATLDGRIATRTGESRWITGEAARADVHSWRRLFPAIAVGAGTVIADDPRLTARVAGVPEHCPLRFVFDGHMRTVAAGAMPGLYTDEFAARTVVVTTQHGGAGYVRKLREMGVGVWVFESAGGRVPFAQFRAKCAAEGITGVLFEGGAQLLSRAAAERQIDYLFAYQAPVLLADERAKSVLGGMRTEKLAQAIRLADVRRHALGDDALVRGRVAYPERIQIDETLFSLG
jgi:diaminohydroxyphosphoribosylaminopyrimidine deaminase / 5-amino-6-(5-phosphoribosylamino)uracil reductase